jgi:three-Cys-motif partner protein
VLFCTLVELIEYSWHYAFWDIAMTEHRFGGLWTQLKLDILRDYLSFYTQALKNQRFDLIYIDSFAGSGRCNIKISGGRKEIDGSAKIALDTMPPFDSYCFIERKPSHVADLETLCTTHSNGDRAVIAAGGAREHLTALLHSRDWNRTRGVLFLDPYGLQCDWETVMEIAKTRALDLFFLVSISGLYRQAANDMANVDSHKAAALDRFLGTTEWRQALYSAPQDDLFGNDPRMVRQANANGLLNYVRELMLPHFGYVAEPKLLNHKGAPLYGLIFAVANKNPAAIALAKRVARDILSKMR